MKEKNPYLFSFSFAGEGFDSMDEIVTSLVSEEAGEFDKSEINASTSGSKGSINEKMSKSMILVKISSVKSRKVIIHRAMSSSQYLAPYFEIRCCKSENNTQQQPHPSSN